jgi:hypothetical protein
MAVAPGHPFLKHTVDNIKRFDLNWYSLYITDMYAVSFQIIIRHALNKTHTGSPLGAIIFPPCTLHILNAPTFASSPASISWVVLLLHQYSSTWGPLLGIAEMPRRSS